MSRILDRVFVGLGTIVFCGVVAVTTAAIPRAQPQPAPLTEVEALKLEVVRLESVVLQRQLDDFQLKRQKLKADLEAPRPGWRFDLESAKFVAIPTESSVGR